MKRDVNELKRFFAGFFQLDPSKWGGFLAGWKNLPGYDDHKDWFSRLKFGLLSFSKLPPDLALGMVGSIVLYALEGERCLELIQSVTPLAGEPEAYSQSLVFRQNQGDLAAKEEAMELLCGGCDRCEEEADAILQDEGEETEKVRA